CDYILIVSHGGTSPCDQRGEGRGTSPRTTDRGAGSVIDGRLCISADGHVELPPEAWVSHVGAAFKDYAPRRVQRADGGDGFLVEGKPFLRPGMNLYGGSTPETFDPQKPHWDTPGTHGPKQRLQEQDADGVDAEILFPGVLTRASWSGLRDDGA